MKVLLNAVDVKCIVVMGDSVKMDGVCRMHGILWILEQIHIS